jgi:carboxymethylenebutenolidase
MINRNARWGAVAMAMVLLALLGIGQARADSTAVRVGTTNSMDATLITPDGPGPYPAVLVLHTLGGIEPADIEYAKRLAGEGYVALVPAYTAAYGVKWKTARGAFTALAQPIYDDLAAAADMLRHHSKVAGSKLGAVGFSLGGLFSTWMAATGKADAGVTYYGALTAAGDDPNLDRFRKAFTKASAPVLIFQGTADNQVPVKSATDLADIVTAVQVPCNLHIYPGAFHKFDRDPGSDANGAAADSWRRTVAFLAKYLKPS